MPNISTYDSGYKVLTAAGLETIPTLVCSRFPFSASGSFRTFYMAFPSGNTASATPINKYVWKDNGNTNTDSIFFNIALNEERVILTLKNGNYVKAKRPNASQVLISFYLSNDTLIRETAGINTPTYAEWNWAGFCCLRVDNVLWIGGYSHNRGSGTFDFNGLTVEELTTFFTGNPVVTDDPYSSETNNTPTGGYGPYDYTSEQETPPDVPSVSAADVGFISLWNPTAAEMKALANWLWTGNFALNTWRAITADPMECILSVGIIPITPTRYQESGVDTKKEIEFVGHGTDVNSYRVTEQYYVIDMGSVHIGGMSNSNMDYAPYAKASIFLPYCGTYALDVDEIMDADISLEYHIDIYTGACVAYLTISGKVNSDEHEVVAVMYQFTGNCLATIPVTSVDHSQFIQSLLFMGASVAATVATAGGGAGAAAAGADLGAETGMSAGAIAASAGSAINTVMSMKPNVLHSGNLSSTAGFLGGQKPYITMTWSNLCRAEEEYKVVGMPLNKSGKLTDFKGLTVVSGVHLENIKCTDTERIMIEQALYKGVIV